MFATYMICITWGCRVLKRKESRLKTLDQNKKKQLINGIAAVTEATEPEETDQERQEREEREEKNRERRKQEHSKKELELLEQVCILFAAIILNN